MKQLIFFLLLLLVSASFCSCGDKTTDSKDQPEPAKTLDKAKVVDQEWYFKGYVDYSHLFKSNGVYGINGSWQWINDSDSMEVIPYQNGNKQILFFEYCTDSELSCGSSRNGPYTLYKNVQW